MTVETRHRERTGLIAWLRRRIGWLADPGPVREVVRSSTPGLADREAEEFAILHDERAKMRNEDDSSGIPTGRMGSVDWEQPVQETGTHAGGMML